MMNTTSDGRRNAVIMVCTFKGEINAARKLVGNAIRKVLGRKATTGIAPWTCYYTSKKGVLNDGYDLDNDPDPRFDLDVTDEEMAAISDTLAEMAKAVGWDRAPVDIYHD